MVPDSAAACGVGLARNARRARSRSVRSGDPSASSIDPSERNRTPSASRTDPSARNLVPSARCTDPSASSTDPSASNLAPSASSRDPSASSLDPSASSRDPSERRRTPSANSLDPSAITSEPSARNLAPSASNLEPSASSLEPSANNLEPSASSADPSASSSRSVAQELARRAAQSRIPAEVSAAADLVQPHARPVVVPSEGCRGPAWHCNTVGLAVEVDVLAADPVIGSPSCVPVDRLVQHRQFVDVAVDANRGRRRRDRVEFQAVAEPLQRLLVSPAGCGANQLVRNGPGIV